MGYAPRMVRLTRPLTAALLASLTLVTSLAAGCGDDDGDSPAKGTQALIDYSLDFTARENFFAAPFPSDARLSATGGPDLRGFPELPEALHIRNFIDVASERKGYPLIPVIWIRWSAALAPQLRTTIIPAEPTSPILLVDIDPDSPDQGTLVPIIAETLADDPFTPTNVLAVAPVPGFLLRENTTYAVIVTTALKDAAGADVLPSASLAALETATGAAADSQRLLWAALPGLNLTTAQLAAASVFTTGDPVGETLSITEKALENYTFSIDNSAIALTTNPDHQGADLCHLIVTVQYPQFQSGTPPYDTDGKTVLDESGAPVKQRDEAAPVTLAIPKLPMPEAGYPIVISIHGTGGYSDSALAPTLDGNGPDADGRYWGRGLSFPLARAGLATVASAMPVNSERVANAPDTNYVNFNNLPVARYNLTQGLIESRMLLRALGDVRIPIAAFDGCLDPKLLGKATEVKFDVSKLVATGQSMGGMYISMLTAMDPLINAVVPTGAGGYFTLQFLINTVAGDAREILGALLRTAPANLSQLHPTMVLANMALEPTDPLVFVQHIARRPLAGNPPRNVLEPMAPNDEYFPPPIYAALAASYRHPRVGASLIPEVDEAQALAGVAPIATYPVTDNFNGVTAALQHYPVSITGSGHNIYNYRDDLRYQLTCFLKTWVTTGTAVILEPIEETVDFSCGE